MYQGFLEAPISLSGIGSRGRRTIALAHIANAFPLATANDLVPAPCSFGY
jgi:hypothetical protein